MRKRFYRVLLMVLVLTGGVGVALGLLHQHRLQCSEREAALRKPLFQQPFIPQELSFAGEVVPLDCEDVYESLDRELCVSMNWHSQILLVLKRANRYFPVVTEILKRHHVPEDFKYLLVAESHLDLLAVSPAGAVGPWQFLAATAQEYGLEVNEDVDERYHLEKSTDAACQFLQKAHDKFGNWTMAAAAYNIGMGGLTRQMEKQQQTSYYDLLTGIENGRYVFRVLAFKLILEKPRDYGFFLTEDELWPLLETYEERVDSTVVDLAAFALEHKSNYKLLKWLNPWLRTNTLPVAEGHSYQLTLLRTRRH
jgi:putative membrane-bound lytic murein transglycosylase